MGLPSVSPTRMQDARISRNHFLCVLWVPFIFRHVKCSSISAVAQGAAFESVSQEALGKGDRAGSEGIDGLHVQLKDNRTPHTGTRCKSDWESGVPV